jgi:hypothetical protein
LLRIYAVFTSRNTHHAIRIYSLVLKQSCIKQQSVYEHCPFEFPKQGVQPSAVWMEWISSAFFIFPGVMPRVPAFFLIPVIVIRFCFTFAAGIFSSFQFFLLSSFAPPCSGYCITKVPTEEIKAKTVFTQYWYRTICAKA